MQEFVIRYTELMPNGSKQRGEYLAEAKNRFDAWADFREYAAENHIRFIAADCQQEQH